MRQIFILLLFLSSLVVLFLGGCKTESASTVTLAGNIKNTNAIALTKVEDINRKKVTLIDRIDVKPDGSFEKSFEFLEPHLYELNFPNGKKIPFFFEPTSKLSISGDANKPAEAKIEGPAANEYLAGYEKFRKESLRRLVLSVRDEIKKLPAKTGPEFVRLSKLEVTNYVKHKDELLDYVQKNMGTSLAIYATSLRWPSDAERVGPIVSAFEKAHPESEITKRLKEKLEVIKQTAIGGTVPDIKMRDETGKEISLNDLKGKYTLIDFWGSWCGPCRRESATLVKLYADLKDQGFEIYGVALESELQLWKDAKSIDKRTWPNVVSLKEFETEAAYDYSVTALPVNYVIDKYGKVIAKDIHDEELDAKIRELFSKK